MSHKIDERKDNIRKIKETIENTQDNMEFANDMMDTIADTKHKKTLEAQNERRADSIDSLQDELKEQIIGKEKKNK
jgi:small acid-soluble spore protein (thioredoxin-like protein)